MKTTISISNQLIPVYIMRTISKNKLSKLLDKLAETLEQKTKRGKQTVQKYLATLDSIEIDGSDAILYSREYIDTLPISLS